MAPEQPPAPIVTDELREQFREFKIPTNDNERVWRYMRMHYFTAMIVTSTAYFRRLDRLEDQFESAYSRLGHDAAVDELTRAAIEHGDVVPEGADHYETSYLAVGSADVMDRASVYVNCWHRNTHESWAMWKLFSQGGVAIRSTNGRVYDGLNPDRDAPRVFPGNVEYIDHETDRMDCPFPWLYKNHMFRWENEARFWTSKMPREHSIFGFNDDHPEGLPMPVDLNTMIEAVIVSPGSSEETRANVKLLLEQNGLPDTPILASAADTIPEYRIYHDLNRQSLLDRGVPIPVHTSEAE